jgi:hypothetical protein
VPIDHAWVDREMRKKGVTLHCCGSSTARPQHHELNSTTPRTRSLRSHLAQVSPERLPKCPVRLPKCAGIPSRAGAVCSSMGRGCRSGGLHVVSKARLKR